MADTNKRPSGSDLLATLINLYCKQEGVKVTYVIERKEAET
jgi:hypothetical protein